MQARGDGDNEGAHLQFYTTSAAAGDMFNGANVERLRVTSEGSTFFYHGGTNHVTVSGLAYCNGVGAGPSPASVCLAVGRDSGSNRSIHCQGHIRIASGYGIQYESSSTSAVLDDYEEGTFTPTLIYQNASGITIATNSASGKYTKIGRVVYILGYINWSVSGSPVNDNIGFGGLPFSTNNGEIAAGNTRFIGNITLYGTSAQSVTHQILPYGTNAVLIFSEAEQGNRANELGGNSNMRATYQFWYHSE